MRLADLSRRAMAILFQDYTHFPLSVSPVPLSSPYPDSLRRFEHRSEKTSLLATPLACTMTPQSNEQRKLGGASELIAHLQMASTPILSDLCAISSQGLPDGMRDLFGRKVDNGRLRRCVDTPADHGLSGGQMQRLAVARTFMRSSSTEQGVGLLLFDEPSASLDPTAEHGTIYPHDVLPFH